MTTDILTIGDVARELNKSVETIRDWDRSGKLKAERTANGLRIYRREAIERLRGLERRESNRG